MGDHATGVGLDLGGTNLRSLLLSESGDILARRIEALPRQASLSDLIDLAVETTHALSADTGVRPVGVGVGIGALLSPSGRPLPGLSNQPSLVGFDVAEHLRDRLGLPCAIENDARAAMRGEAAFGAARGRDNAICITVGSGIGSGLLIGGCIHEGSHNLSGELGLARIPGPGAERTTAWAHLEDLAAPGAIRRRTGRALEDHLLAASNGDRDAAALVDTVHDMLGAAIANAHALLDFDVAILTGGITNLGEPFRSEIERAHRRHSHDCYHNLDIVLAAFGEWSGAAGAACLVLDAPGGSGDRR